MKQLLRFASACGVVVGSAVGAFAQAEPACQATEIDSIYGHGAYVHAINEWGQVVGYVEQTRTSPGETAFVWHHGRTRELPGFEPSDATSARSINNFGQVVGFVYNDEGQFAVSWTRGRIALLPSQGRRGSATDINNLGQIVGYREGDGNGSARECLLWPSARSEPIVLGSRCQAEAINDLGVVVGQVTSAGGVSRGFVWEKGVMTDIGVPPPAPGSEPFERSALVDINNWGWALGYTEGPQTYETIAWSRRTGPRSLEIDGFARSMNEWGTIAASYAAPNSPLFLVSPRGRVRHRGALGGNLQGGLVINDLYQVAWTTFAETETDVGYSSYFCQLR